MTGDVVYDGMKWCSRGRHLRPVEEFRPNDTMLSGLNPWCKDCVSSYAREWREANPEAVKRYQAQQRAEYAAVREPLERECANPDCGRVFTPSRRDARTCSRECRSRLGWLRKRERQS